jgi:hypothetical protein
MAEYLDMTAANAALKEYYDGQKVENLAYDTRPTLTMLPKDPKATGKYVPIPLVYEVSQGNSANFTNAQANQAPELLAEFLLTLSSDYSLATLEQQAMLASMDEKGSFIKFSKDYVDKAIQASAQRASVSLFRSGTGSRGAIATGGITSGVITLSNPSDVTNFGINMVLTAHATDGGAARAALGYVIARNVSAGTITVSATSISGSAGSPSLWAAGDFLMVQGDLNSVYKGFAGWLPSTAPGGSDSFYGVNRSSDSRLYGLYYNGNNAPIEEAIIDSALYNAREGGQPGHFITNFASYSALAKALGARREFVNLETDGGIKFRGVKLIGPNGDIECFADRNCQPLTGWLLQMNTWKLYSLNAVPFIFKYGDGLEMLRVANADASEVRVGFYAGLGCNAPGFNSQVTLQQ